MPVLSVGSGRGPLLGEAEHLIFLPGGGGVCVPRDGGSGLASW